jgi:hydroxyacylglutathione hydrolase
MLFKRFYDQKLAQASYLLACEASGEALVVDPNRDVEFYLNEAKRERLRISHVTETHIHADFVSGSRELAHLARARLYLSGEGGADWQYAFAKESGATLLRDGDTISFGRIMVKVLHTPGHTPEHLAFLVTDLASSPEPIGMLSGDFIFVGDVGRPDLLERAAGQSGTMDSAAHALFASLQKTRGLSDYLQIWPGHGAGSACGKALGAMPQSTMGYERIANWGLRATDESAFVKEVLAGQPAPPRYFAIMKAVNREGPALTGGLKPATQIALEDVMALVDSGGVVVDCRALPAYGREHIAGSLNIPFNKSFTKWAGSIISYDTDFCLLTDTQGGADIAREVARDLSMIGLDKLVGYATDDVIAQWRDAGRTTETSSAVGAAQADSQVRDASVNVIDVRDEYELADGRLPGALNIPLATLPGRVAEVPNGRPIIVYCQGGGRSGIAASILQSAGHKAVINLTGGFSGWQKAGLPTEP